MQTYTGPPEKSSTIRRLTIFFGLVYFAQGLSGLVRQPLDYFLKQGLGLNPAQATEYLAILTIPWVIKPLYGLVSDFVPLLGYRRKSYLYIINPVAVLAYLWLTGLNTPSNIIIAILITQFGTAISDVLVDALMVETGQERGMVKQFQSTQWMCLSIAAIISVWLGGYLSQNLDPDLALHVAAEIAMLAPLSVLVGSWLLVKEKKTRVDWTQFKLTAGSFYMALRSKTLWAVALFLFCWDFSPHFGMPIYYHMLDNLKFTQGFIGEVVDVCSGVSMMIGAFIYRKFLADRFSTKQLVIMSILIGGISTLSKLLIVVPNLNVWFTMPTFLGGGAVTGSQFIAVAIYSIFGIASMVSHLTMLNLAADACPKQAEGFTFAALMSLSNGTSQLSSIIGARLYVYYLGGHLAPLILISASFTFACFLAMPLLKGVFCKEEEQRAARLQ